MCGFLAARFTRDSGSRCDLQVLIYFYIYRPLQSMSRLRRIICRSLLVLKLVREQSGLRTGAVACKISQSSCNELPYWLAVDFVLGGKLCGFVVNNLMCMSIDE